MFGAGLPQEAGFVLLNMPGPTARQAIGYKEFAPWITGEQSLSQIAEQIKIATRHYAKRQLTWFRRMRTLTWLDNADVKKTLETIKTLLI
jgi:tRNA dimethylallyltransferase